LFSKTIFIKGLFGSLGEEDFELKEGWSGKKMEGFGELIFLDNTKSPEFGELKLYWRRILDKPSKSNLCSYNTLY
jgi:hypothetical protein